MGLNPQRRERFAIIYCNKPQLKGLATYLRLAPQATSKQASLNEAERYVKDFVKAPGLNQDKAAVVRRHAQVPLTETISAMVAGAQYAC